MADNTMGGLYGGNDVGLSVGIELSNIDRSIEEASTLATQIKQWREDNEAFVRSLSDTQEALTMLTTEYEKQKSLRQETIGAEEQLRDLSAQIRDNARSTAQTYQEISGILNTMNTNLGVPSVPGMGPAASAPYGNVSRITSSDFSTFDSDRAASPSSAPLSSGGGGGGGGGGAFYDPFSDDSDPLSGSGGGGDSDLADLTPITGPGRRSLGNWKSVLHSYGGGGQRGLSGIQEIQRVLSLPQYGMRGRAASWLRYGNRITNGGLYKAVSKPWLVGHSTYSTNSVESLARAMSGAELSYKEDLLRRGMETLPGVVKDPVTGAVISGAVLPEDIIHESYQRNLSTLQGLQLEGKTADEAEAVLQHSGLLSGNYGAALSGALTQARTAGSLSGGLISGLSKAAPWVGGALAVGKLAYGGYAWTQRASQMYGGLTGDTSSLKGMGMGIEARFMSGFGLNPRMDYQHAMEILGGGLAQGYKGDLMTQYRDYAYGAYTKYQVDPQQSLANFNNAVNIAGGTMSTLSTTLDQLAKTAATTNTSFKSLQQQQTAYIGALTSMGWGGDMATSIGAAAAESMANNPALAGHATSANLLTSITGLAMASSVTGTPLSQMYGAASGTNMNQSLKLLGATDTYVRRILQSIVGVSPQSSNFNAVVESKWMQLTMVLQKMVPPINGQKEWDPRSAVEYTKQLLKGQSGVGTALVGDAERAITGLLGGQGLNTNAGLTNFFNNLTSATFKTGHDNINGHTADQIALQYTDNGVMHTVTADEAAKMSFNEKMNIYKQVAGSGRHIAQAYRDQQGKIHMGQKETLGSALNNQLLNAVESNKVSPQSLIALTPEAANLVRLLKNPSMADRGLTKHASAAGFGSNTSSASHSSHAGGWFDTLVGLGEVAAGGIMVATLGETGVGAVIGAEMIGAGIHTTTQGIGSLTTGG